MIVHIMPNRTTTAFLAFLFLGYHHLDITTENAVRAPNTRRQSSHTGDIVHVLIRMPIDNSHTAQRYEENLEGLISFSSVPLHLHLMIPKEGYDLIDQILTRVNESTTVSVTISKYDLSEFTRELSSMAKTDFGQDPDFSEMLADRMPILLFPFKFPQLKRLIVLETRITVQSDIAELHAHFRHFSEQQLVGIALQQVPKYRHSFTMYEKYNPASGLGRPARPGFNTAVLLLDLHKMRHSITLNAFLHYPSLRWLVHKYWFTKDDNPVISQEDVFTLMGFEHPELFYILPCGWNRQMDLIGFSQSEARDYSQCEGKVYAENFQE